MAKASIIIPVYNKEDYLKETLQSVDKQTESDLEVIIIDDKSTDHGIDIIRDFQSNTKKQVKLIQNDKNMGVAYSRNIGIEESKSDYIAFLDADDLLDKNFMKVLLAKMKKHPDLDFIRGGFCHLNDGGTTRFRQKSTIIGRKIKIELEPDYLASEIGSANGRLYQKDVIKNLKFYKGSFEDYDFVLNLLSSSKHLLFTDKVYYHYRLVRGSRNDSSIQNISTSCLAYFEIWERLLERNPNISPKILEHLWKFHFYTCNSYFGCIAYLFSDEDLYQFGERYFSCLNYYHTLEERYQGFVTYSIRSQEELEIQKQKLKEIAMKY